MPDHSQNGLLVLDRSGITVYTVPGTDVKLPLATGPVGEILVAFAARWHREVEPLVTGTCWGWAVRTVRGSSTVISNHASGSAIDLNAPQHGLGTAASASFTPAQIATIHRILDDFQGALRWGGDYSDPARGGVRGSRPDPMHIEANDSEAACAAALASLAAPVSTATPLEDDLMASIPITPDAGGRFHHAVGCEAGGGSQIASKGWVTVGSTYGGTTFTVAALSADAKVLGYWKDQRANNNRSLAFQLPDGTRAVTLEGVCDNTGTRPWASTYSLR